MIMNNWLTLFERSLIRPLLVFEHLLKVLLLLFFDCSDGIIITSVCSFGLFVLGVQFIYLFEAAVCNLLQCLTELSLFSVEVHLLPGLVGLRLKPLLAHFLIVLQFLSQMLPLELGKIPYIPQIIIV